MENCKIIAVANQKGGTGKSTACNNLSVALTNAGKRVLLADFDPQTNLSMCAGVNAVDSLLLPINDVLRCVMDGVEIPGNYIFHGKKVDIIPGSKNLTVTEVNLRDEMGSEKVLSELLEPLRNLYDYIIIDTSPSLGMLTINALAACDSVIIPVSPEYWSATGLTDLVQTIDKIKRKINPRIEIAGILLTVCDERTVLFREVKSLVDDFCAGRIKVFNTRIPGTTKVGRANLYSVDIMEFDPKNPAATAYIALAEEVMQYVFSEYVKEKATA